MRAPLVATTVGIIALLVTAAPAFAESFMVGSRVHVQSGPLNARTAADVNSRSYGMQSAGVQGTIFQGPIEQGGHTWWFIDFDSGVDGWCAEKFLSTAPISQVAGAASADIQINQWAALYWQLKNIVEVLQRMKAAPAI